MKRIMFMYGLILIFTFMFFIQYTTPTDDAGDLYASVESDDWVMLFNDFQEFVDDNEVTIEVVAPAQYDGW